MNNDIVPTRGPQSSSRPVAVPPRPTGLRPPVANVARNDQSHPPLAELPPVQPSTQATPGGSVPPKPPASSPDPLPSPKLPWYRRWQYLLILSLGLILLAVAAGFLWYKYQLQPVVRSASAETVAIEIPAGTSPDRIAELLKDKSLIRSQLAFNIHTRLQGIRPKLLAGTYRLSAAESTPEIAAHLTTGQVDEFSVTFYPGSALNFTSGTDKTPSHRAVLERLGYSSSEIDEAFAANYDHPLLVDKPASADLEGYIYGQTYQVAAGSSVKQILTRTFDEFYNQLESKDVLSAIDERGMTLHEAVILASVVEREVSSNIDDQRQVAQVFHLRLEKDMPLGADATFVYAAKRLGVAPSVNLDSPYNTRKNKGLPPGPIASPGIGAMEAVARPAEGDYLFFVSGDDGRNYFSKTIEEHETNTQKYCQENCSLF